MGQSTKYGVSPFSYCRLHNKSLRSQDLFSPDQLEKATPSSRVSIPVLVRLPPRFRMSAKYVSGTLIKNITTGGKTLGLQVVDKTTAWTRPSGFPTESVTNDFTNVAAKNASKFKSSVTTIAMK